MKLEQAKPLYESYDKFIQDFILGKNSILSNHKNILTDDSINECIKLYHDNFKDDKRNFDEKIKEQFDGASIEVKLIFAHAEWLWSFMVDDIRIESKKAYTIRTTELKESDLNLNVYKNGFGSAGQWHTNNKYNEILFNLFVIRFIHKENQDKKLDLKKIKVAIEEICLYHKYEQEPKVITLSDEFKSELPVKSLAQTNLLTYIGHPDKYERIASNKHKTLLYNSFKVLLSEKDEEETKNLDEKIFKIREALTNFVDEDFDFYTEEKVRKVWNYSISEEDFSEIQGLQYKKAIIMYGPPGTSKTHTATELAKALITNGYLRDKERVKKYFESNHNEFVKDRIHNLQLHPNYTYEDFIAGYQLRNGNTKIEKGVLFDVCEKACGDELKLPHVLILDEINRVDLSRLFGEVFSAIENRGKDVKLGVGDVNLNIPQNLYIIGTMNEIDFSLEQMDFALRRRFLWFFYGFDEGKLKSIMKFKNEELNAKLKLEEELDRFVQNASSLNQEISRLPELGKQYQIGHTFFAEIVDIYISYKELNGIKTPKNQIYHKDGIPAKILWEISIEPILMAFLGNLSPDEMEEIKDRLFKIYISK